jgi:hypothetical protein
MSDSLLRRVLEETAAGQGCGMKDLTVLAPQNDPFRLDTPARHRDGEWLAVTAAELGLGDRTIHLRGLHYMVIGQSKPNGTPFTNTDKDWTWLEHAAKSARWLGYIPFEQIVDQRNAAPIVEVFEQLDPCPYFTVGIDVEIPDVEDITPQADVVDFTGTQPYKLVIFGEKSSLADVLSPLAREYGADLYLPTGEISDTLLYQMARIGAEDRRPMVVFTFSDADPAGWQMPISIARKLQAFRAGRFPEIEFQVRRIALTPGQVREYGLPSTPLKDEEKRADKWRQAMGTEQTEIDALATLRPDLLVTIVRDALDPFFDRTLDERVAQARSRWLHEARAALDDQLDAEQLARIRAEAARKLATMAEEIDALNRSLQLTTGELELPVPEVPAAELNGRVHGVPLLDSRWSFAQQCRRLIDSKEYRNAS